MSPFCAINDVHFVSEYADRWPIAPTNKNGFAPLMQTEALKMLSKSFSQRPALTIESIFIKLLSAIFAEAINWSISDACLTIRAYIKIEEIRKNDGAKENKDIAKEYRIMLEKLEAIRKGRHLAILGEENEEKILYKKILDIIYKTYKEVSVLNKDYVQISEKLYDEIKSIVDGYVLYRKANESENDSQKQRKEEEQERWKK